MKRTAPFLSLLALLAVVSGYLLSKISLLGKVGISLAYKEYRFLRTWWKGAAVYFGIWLLLFLLQGWADRRLSRPKARFLHGFLIGVAVAGLYLTYDDFRNNLSHKFLGERFHIGGYLFWVGWIAISLFYLFQNRVPHAYPEAQERRPGPVQTQP